MTTWRDLCPPDAAGNTDLEIHGCCRGDSFDWGTNTCHFAGVTTLGYSAPPADYAPAGFANASQSEATAFVNWQYFLARKQPDTAGVTFWAGLMVNNYWDAQGIAAHMAWAFSHPPATALPPATTAQIQSWYIQYTGRAATAADIAFWGASPDASLTQQNIYGSPEAQAFRAHPPPAPGPQPGPRPAPSPGAPPAPPAPLPPAPNATVQQVTDWYGQYLGRAPVQADLNFWTSQPANYAQGWIANSPEAIAHTFLITHPPATAQQVDAWYVQYLCRHAEQAGINFWVSLPDAQHTQNAIAASPEAQLHLGGCAGPPAPAPTSNTKAWLIGGAAVAGVLLLLAGGGDQDAEDYLRG